MAIEATAAAENVHRAGCFSPSQSWTVCFWANFASIPPTTANFRTLYLFGDVTFTNSYIWIGLDGSANFDLETFDGTTTLDDLANTAVIDTWYFCCIRYDITTTTLTLLVSDADGELGTASLTVDFGGFTFTETDEYFCGDDTAPGLRGVYHRVWQRLLTDAEVELERVSILSVLQTNLLAETTLLRNLEDRIGSFDWTADGSVTFIDPQSYLLQDAESFQRTGLAASTTFAVVELNPDTGKWHVVYNISNGDDNLNILIPSATDVTVNVLNSQQQQYSGLYYLVPNKLNDTLNDVDGEPIDVAKPNPFIETGFVRDM